MRVGFIGIGRMGEPMVLRLIQGGFAVIAWNRTRSKLDSVVAAGATAAENIAKVAAESDVVLTMVTDDRAVELVYADLLGMDVRGKTFVDMSTVLPETEKRVAAHAAAKGAAFVDAPVAGTVQPAREGRLLIFAGGDESDIKRLKPVFDILARRVEHFGPVGSGAAMKLVHNALLTTYWSVLAEAMGMGSRYGLDFKQMLEMIGQSPAAFAALAVKMPLLLGEPADVGFNIQNVKKDLTTISRFAESLGTPMPIAHAALENYEKALAGGYAAEDVAAIVRFHQRR